MCVANKLDIGAGWQTPSYRCPGAESVVDAVGQFHTNAFRKLILGKREDCQIDTLSAWPSSAFAYGRKS